MKFTTRRARAYHCGAMSRRLRRDHVAAMPEGAPAQAHRMLRELFDQSAVATAVYLEDELVGIYGITGLIASGKGFVWAAFSESCARHPLTFVRQAKAELAKMLETRYEIETTIIKGDVMSMRLASRLGFEWKGVIPYGNGAKLLVYSLMRNRDNGRQASRH